MSAINITLPKNEKERLQRLALRYGPSLPEFSRKILQELSEEIPEESFADYKKPRELKASLKRALRDWKAGRVSVKL